MAPKRRPHELPPPIHSFESESEDSSSSDDSDSEPQQLTQPKPQEPHQDSQESSGSDSDSGSDADSDSSSDKTQMPPSVVPPQPKKPTSTPAQLKANGKRPAEMEQDDKVSKSKKSKNVEKVDKGSNSDKTKSVEKVGKGLEKSKLSNGEGSEEKKTAPFARLFSEKDEIVLLEGMIDYREKKGADPSLDIVAFHQSIEDMLSCSATKNQIVDKIRRLRKKFVNNLRRGQNGEDPVISRPHEYKSYELSKKIWGSEVQGSEVDGDSKGRNSRKKNKKVDNGGNRTPLRAVRKESDIDEEVMHRNEVETEDCWSLYPLLCASIESEAIKNFKEPMNPNPKEYVKKVVSRLEKEKATELEHDWNDFIVMEQQVNVKRLKTITKQAEVAMNVMKP